MAAVWIVEQCEYEQRGVVAVFATKELADAYCAEFESDEEPREFPLIDTAPVKCRHYHAEGVYGADNRFDASVYGRDWEPVDGGRQRRHSWESNTAYVPFAVDEQRVSWWRSRFEPGPVYVIASGNDQAAVEARFAELWAAVVDGFRPPIEQRASA